LAGLSRRTDVRFRDDETNIDAAGQSCDGWGTIASRQLNARIVRSEMSEQCEAGRLIIVCFDMLDE